MYVSIKIVAVKLAAVARLHCFQAKFVSYYPIFFYQSTLMSPNVKKNIYKYKLWLKVIHHLGLCSFEWAVCKASPQLGLVTELSSQLCL